MKYLIAFAHISLMALAIAVRADDNTGPVPSSLETKGRSGTESDISEVNSHRVEALAAMLSADPAGFGRPVSNRSYWSDAERRTRLADSIHEAERLLTAEFPRWDDDAYLDYSRTGKRKEGEAMQSRRSAWLAPLVLAECLENSGRFMDRINMVLGEYAREPTWTWPAHDGNLNCFYRRHYIVDLRSATFAHELAQSLYLLGSKVSPEVRRAVESTIRERVFASVKESLRTGKGNSWLRIENNWNAVCLAGVTGAALANLADRRERAEFAAVAEHFSRYFLAGFPDDGYCTEGVGYWNYGFGNFALLRDELHRATAGRLDLFADPKIRNIALFGARIQMAPGNAPAFGDCHLGTVPDASLLAYCDRALRLGLGSPTDSAPAGGRGSLVAACREPAVPVADARQQRSDADAGLRWFFPDAGVLICRPAPGTAGHLVAAIKAGGNASHRHDDIGSFVIGIGTEQLVGDPGGPAQYERGTFSPQRRTYPMINSFGHPVPLIGGQMQVDSGTVKPKVLRTQFTPERDEIAIDLASAYSVAGLKKLERTMRLIRGGVGRIVIEDAFEFDRPTTFEMALPTHSQFRQSASRRLEFKTGDKRLTVDVESPGDFSVATEPIEGTAPPATRVAIRLNAPQRAGMLRLTFRPPDK
jgi:hypothetical protein